MLFKKKLKNHTAPYDKNKSVKRDNFTFMNKTICQHNQIVLVGDSITEMLPSGDWFGNYTAKTGLRVYNRGISGDTSDRLYERFEDNVLSIKPQCIVLLIGINDQRRMAEETTADYVEKIISLTKEKCPETKVILEAIYPINTADFKDAPKKHTNEKVLKANGLLSVIAKKYGAVYLDFTEKLVDEKGNLNSEYSFDGLHLNAKGYEVVTGELVKYLPEK